MSKITSVSRADHFLKYSGAILKFEFGGVNAVGECLSLLFSALAKARFRRRAFHEPNLIHILLE